MFHFKFIKFLPSEYVLRYKKGKITQEGVGLSFFYYAPTTSVVVVPIASADVPFMFEEVTNDYQTVTIQGQITYRVTDYKKIAQIMDYTYDMKTKRYIVDNSQKIAQRLINISKVLAKKHLENMAIRDAIRASESLASSIIGELRDNEEIKSLGIGVMGFSVLAVLPNKETARALEAQAREEILRKADEALYERRNASIEQERRVKENELNTEIAVEEKKKQIEETRLNTELAVEEKKKLITEAQLDAKRLAMQKENEIKDEELNFQTAREEKIRQTQLEAKRLTTQKENEIKAEDLVYRTELENKQKALVALSAQNSRMQADTKAYELSAMLKTFAGVDIHVVQSLANMGMKPDKLIASAFQDLAEKAEKIGQLNITPDLLQSLLQGKGKE